MRSLRTLALVMGALGFISGCTALLGSYEVQQGPTDAAAPGEGGGSDGPVDTEGGKDAAPDAPPLLLACTVNKNRGRILATALPPMFGGGGQLSFDNPHVFHLTSGKVRVVTRPSQSAGFTVYELDPNSGGTNVVTLDIPTSGRIYDVVRTSDAILVLASGSGANQGRLEVHRIADVGAVADTVIPLTMPGAVNEMSAMGTNGPRASVIPLGPVASPDYFYAFTAAPSAAGPFDMTIGRASTSAVPPKLLYTSNDPTNPASPRALISAGSEIFIPLETKNDGPPTASDQMIHTPDNAAAAVLAQPRSLGKAGGKPNILFGVGPAKGAVNAHNFAFIEVDTASATPLAFRIGSIPDAKIGTFVAEDIPISFTFDSVTRLPADGGDSRWLGDQYVATGRGMGVSGMNFLWYDTTVNALRANQTGPDTILKDHTDIRRSSITFSGAPTAIYTQFDLVFTEGATVDGSMTETLNYAEVDCLH